MVIDLQGSRGCNDRPLKIPKAPSPGEAEFAFHCAQRGLTPEREYRFDITRMWRFDFAWPERKLAVEVEGGLSSFGRHQQKAGYTNDCEKYNAAARQGWMVLRYTTAMVKSGRAILEVVEELCDGRR